MLSVSFHNGAYVCKTTFESRNIVKNAGFKWDVNTKTWRTRDHAVALRLKIFLDDKAKAAIEKNRVVVSPWANPLVIPKNLKLFEFQYNAALFALSRNKSYLGLDPGLGKTPIAAVIANTLVHDNSRTICFYICPPFLTRNTENEFNKWAPNLKIMRREAQGDNFSNTADVIIYPDSIISRDEIITEITSLIKFLRNQKHDNFVLFVDEAHRFKNDTAKRTKALFSALVNQFDKMIYLSGTPMPNRPIELYPVLNASCPESINSMSKHEYALKFCAAIETRFGWDYSGASNLKELSARVFDKFMLRYKKADVLKELPPKLEEMILLGDSVSLKLSRMGQEILKHHSPEDLMKGVIKELVTEDGEDLHLSTYRKELGAFKVKAAAEYIDYILSEYEDESILVFAVHKEVIRYLDKALTKYSPLIITGDTRMELRSAMVNEFQKDERRRLFIGNIQAAGTGFTLTKATRVIFVEFSWTPADNDQASDRAHRIGQENTVLVQYLVYKDSIDRAVIETILRKKQITAHI